MALKFLRAAFAALLLACAPGAAPAQIIGGGIFRAPAAGGGGGGSTWDPTDFNVADTFGHARITLDATKLIATEFNGNGGPVVASTTGAASGLCRFEVVVTDATSSVGLELAVHKTDGAQAGLFGGGGGLDWIPDGRVFIGFTLMATVSAYSPGDHLGIEIDKPNNLAYFLVNGGARSSPGVDISGMAGLLYPAADLGTVNGTTATLNTGPTWSTTATGGYGGC